MTRPLALTVLALTAAGIAGCSEFSQQTTNLQYAPSDGTQVTLQNGVGVRNALFLSQAQGDPATLITTLVNQGDQDQTVTFSGQGISGTVPVQAGRTVMVGPHGDTQLEVPAIPARPGELVTVEVSAGSASSELKIPVLDGTLPEFRGLVPTVSPTSTATPSAETPSPSVTPFPGPPPAGTEPTPPATSGPASPTP